MNLRALLWDAARAAPVKPLGQEMDPADPVRADDDPCRKASNSTGS